MAKLTKDQQNDSFRSVQSLLRENNIYSTNRVESDFDFSPQLGHQFLDSFEFEIKQYGYDEPYYVIYSNAFKSPSIFQKENPKSKEILFYWNEIDKKLEFNLNNQPVFITK